MEADRKIYDTKLFGGIEFQDFWNLREHPLYIRLEKKQRPHFIFNEIPTLGYQKVDSLTGLANLLRKSDWVFLPRYWKHISYEIQSTINIPYTEL